MKDLDITLKKPEMINKQEFLESQIGKAFNKSRGYTYFNFSNPQNEKKIQSLFIKN